MSGNGRPNALDHSRAGGDVAQEPWPRLLSALRSGAEVGVWRAAARRLSREPGALSEHCRRTATVALLATHTVDFYAELLPVAGLAAGVDLRVVRAPFGQLEQELLGPSPQLAAARPDYVLLAADASDLPLAVLDGPGADGRGADGRGADGRGADGRGGDGRDAGGRGAGGRGAGGRGADGRGGDGRGGGETGVGDPDAVVRAAVRRWTSAWAYAAGALSGPAGPAPGYAGRAHLPRVIQQTFVVPDDDAYGNASGQTPDGAEVIVGRINAELLRRGRDEVLFVDCARLAARLGRRHWHDPRLWHTLRQPVSFEALPLLAATTAGVIAADLGLTRRCLVLDLDNTLWGGVLAEDGCAGVELGHGAAGEAYTRFQEYLLALRRRGMVLAVASKNDADLAGAALSGGVPGMRLRWQDFAAVVADWRPKSAQILDIARRLRLGLDSIAFVDDNPAERAEVAAALPAVDVIDLPASPAGYLRALADRPTLTTPPPTAADRVRARSYAAARQAALSAAAAGTIEEFLDGLRMRATVRRLAATDLNRAAQLVQKTNQFNLTTARRGREELAGLAADPRWLCYLLELSDRFADHGATGLLLARLDGPAAELDTLLLSCRIIGRTAERRLLAVAADGARVAGCRLLRGVFVPSDRNELVRSLYPSLGFAAAESGPSRCTYEYDLTSGPPLDTPHISNGTISNGTISNGTISGGTVSNGTISGGTVSGGTVSGGTVSGGSVSGGAISEDSHG